MFDLRRFVFLPRVVISNYTLCFGDFHATPSIDSTHSFVYNTIIGSEHIKIILLKGIPSYE